MQIDCGNGRAGVLWDDEEAINIIKFIQNFCVNTIKFQGIYTHCGNTYTAVNWEQVDVLRTNTVDCIIGLVTRLKAEGLKCPTWGIGSTPSCSHNSEKVLLIIRNVICYTNIAIMVQAPGSRSDFEIDFDI